MKFYYSNNLTYAAILIFVLLLTVGCKKLIEVDAPVNNINTANVYNDDITAAAAITGIYIKMSRNNNSGYLSNNRLETIYTSPGFLADEFELFDIHNSTFGLAYKNELTSVNPLDYWQTTYEIIFGANSAIEGLKASHALTPVIKQQLLGEAYFIRAFCYFYLVNFYGGVPLAVTTDYQVNRLLSRSPQSEVYAQIEEDLLNAQSLLSEDYRGGDISSVVTDRVRPNKGAATALLARVYLYMGSSGDNLAWEKSEAEATRLIDNHSLYDTLGLDEVFLKNSKEALWQLQPVGTGSNSNTGQGKFFVLPEQNSGMYMGYLSRHLIETFESNDERFTHWVGVVNWGGTIYHFPNKYKIGAGENVEAKEYSTILRLAEQYLIRAEARAHQDNFSGAAADLNVIRKRARLDPVAVMSKEEMLEAIYRERKLELFSEGAHRWFDLKRTGRADKVLGPIKGSTWQTTDQYLPIPAVEISKSVGLQGHQNPGYQ